jgi:hypothetical protein
MSTSVPSESASHKIERVHCNKCLQETRHSVLHQISHNIDCESYKIDLGVYDEIMSTITSTLLQCCGCEFVTLRQQDYFSEWENIPPPKFYPPSISRPLPKWHEDLPEEIQSLFKEVYIAFHADSRRLALMGVRTLIDLFMNEKIGDIGNFDDKLKKLVEEGYLAKNDRDMLKTNIDAGSAAAHRGYNPSAEILSHTIDVAEHLWNSTRIHQLTEAVKASTPPRSKKTSPSS